MNVTIAIDPDHPGESWWRVAREAKRAPAELRPLLTGKANAIEVAPKRAREIRAWCAALEGWDREAAPLSFIGLIGRPPSPRRGAVGARSLHVRIAPYELALLEPLASVRGQSLVDLLLTSAMVEARREEARATDDGDGDEARAEVVALDAIEVGDTIYTDLRLPRGHAERVTAVQREHNLWRVELASGPPAWFGNGARVWRKRKRVRT